MTIDQARIERIIEAQERRCLERAIAAGRVPLNPAMIRLAREYRGLARWELARCLRVKATDVAAWEDDRADARGYANGLAEVLGMALAFFTQDDEVVPVRICTRDCCSDAEPPARQKSTHTPEDAAPAAAAVTAAWDARQRR